MLGAIAAALANLILVLLIRRISVRNAFDAVDCYLATMAVLLVWRPLVIALSFDQYFPDSLFGLESTDLLINAQLAVTGWLFASAIGIQIGRSLTRGRPWLPGGSRPFTEAQLLAASLVLLLLALAVTVPLWLQFGGPSGLTTAFKRDKAVSATFLRLPAIVGALFATATVLQSLEVGRPGQRKRAVRFAALAALAGHAYLSYSWGARDVPVIAAIALTGGASHYHLYPKSRKWKLALGLGATVTIAFGLRLVRDIAINEAVLSTINDQSFVRQVSVGANLAKFDAFSLVLRDWPSVFDFRLGEDFVASARSAIPLIPDDPDSMSVALRVATTYIPNRANGWPISPIGDWYINFGYFGIFLGGLLSGWTFGWLQHRTMSMTTSPLLFTSMTYTALTWLQGGIWAKSLNVGWQFSLALILAIFGCRLIPRSTHSPLLRNRNSHGTAGTRKSIAT